MLQTGEGPLLLPALVDIFPFPPYAPHAAPPPGCGDVLRILRSPVEDNLFTLWDRSPAPLDELGGLQEVIVHPLVTTPTRTYISRKPLRSKLLTRPDIIFAKKTHLIRERVLPRLLFHSGVWRLSTRQEQLAAAGPVKKLLRSAFQPITGLHQSELAVLPMHTPGKCSRMTRPLPRHCPTLPKLTSVIFWLPSRNRSTVPVAHTLSP